MIMLAAQLCLRTVSGFRAFSDQAYLTPCVKDSFTASSSSFRLSFRFGWKATPFRGGPRLVLISCKSSYPGSFFGARSGNGDDYEYLEASILLPESISHYRMQKHGLGEQFKRPPYRKLSFSIVQAKEPRVSAIEEDFLRRFQSPTIFLKISCDGDFLLPISVGEFAIQKLIDNLEENANGECPDQFELVHDVSERLGCDVKEVRITERVVNTYFARIYFGKSEGNEILSVDARPSDAMIVANRCKAPIYVSKQIVFTDAIRLVHGVSRVRDRKPTYDVSLDSAIDGPDSVAEELSLLMNMNLAAKEERYKDAAMLRDKLMKLRYNT
ncbi:bifunctional nuclease 2-like isoform X2 [Tripterygium wilfordii]|uniref:bifunctional nuclease 2-like isoform X2 n=1 Tax=Tripterygium wilfordii TaxID=458696 RepID=UPI0018F81496|nr:bifunctional nuclease 2-like isoform X2 [Tripterygium wilfordii]XP_038723519.1 bifunctional nuclease 2-like isoform X2 [Tripterygium wilfordii]